MYSEMMNGEQSNLLLETYYSKSFSRLQLLCAALERGEWIAKVSDVAGFAHVPVSIYIF